jgi:hypothetical protein
MRVASKPPSADKIDTRPTSQVTSLPGQGVALICGPRRDRPSGRIIP